MKKIFAIFVAMLFVASLSVSVVGCKKLKNRLLLLQLKHRLLKLHRLPMLQMHQYRLPKLLRPLLLLQNNCLRIICRQINRAFT